MNLLHALILGIVQGLTEFLPISSSAHLKLASNLLGIENPHVLFDLACHLGTLAALFLFLRTEIRSLFLAPKRLLLLFLATLPLIPAYFLLKPVVADYLGFFLMCTALLLFLAHLFRNRVSHKSGGVRDVLCIGTMQSLALFPGISRSASTISCAKMLGWTTKEAVTFSFLLSIPTVLGGNLITLFSSPPPFAPTIFLTGFLTAGVVGFFSIRFAMKWLERGKFIPFACYCLVLGVLVVLYG